MLRIRIAPSLLLGLTVAHAGVACRSENPAELEAGARVETLNQNGPAESAWAEADRQTRRLGPQAFANVPSAIAAELQRLGCTIPQSYATAEPHNVVSGRFLSAANQDWAVLCSRDRVSTLLVFSNGAVAGMRELESSPDANWLQGVGGDQIGFSRAIAVADAQYIASHYEEYGGPKPPPLDHEGINDIFVEKGSTVLYWYQGAWRRLQGAD